MKIVIATDKHIPEIVELWKESMDFHKKLDSYFAMRKDAYLNFEKHIGGLITSADSQVIVALDNDRVVGFCASSIKMYPPVFEHETYGEISDMVVTSGYRRKGIGERILNGILDWLKSQEIVRVELSVAVKNQVGYSFWKKQGFRATAHRLYLCTGK